MEIVALLKNWRKVARECVRKPDARCPILQTPVEPGVKTSGSTAGVRFQGVEAPHSPFGAAGTGVAGAAGVVDGAFSAGLAGAESEPAADLYDSLR